MSLALWKTEEEYQSMLKQHLKEQYKRVKQESKSKNDSFPWTLKEYLEMLGYDWDGPATPKSGIPNIKRYVASDVSTNDGFDTQCKDHGMQEALRLTSSEADRSLEDAVAAQVENQPESINTSVPLSTSQPLPSPNAISPITSETSASPGPPTKTGSTPTAEANEVHAGNPQQNSIKPMKIPLSIQNGTFLPGGPDANKRRKTSQGAATNRPAVNVASSAKGQVRSTRMESSSPTTAALDDRMWGNDIPWLKDTKEDTRLNSQIITELQNIRSLMDDCRRLKILKELPELYNKIRSQLHKARHFHVDEKILKRSRILNMSGLPGIFCSGVQHQYPFDIRADSKELAVRWRHREFDPDILRHVIFKNTKHGKLDEDRVKFGANHVGDGDLVNGQWFPLWLCAVRDGAHGSTQAGIYGKKGHGAYSIVMAGAYEDTDCGDVIEYCGVESAEGSSMDANSTQLLRENWGRPDRPVRVIRAAKFKESKYRPEQGLRYDGLYVVKDVKVIDEKKRAYRFVMERVAGQDPIRWKGLAKRPTQEEIHEYELHKARLGGKLGD